MNEPTFHYPTPEGERIITTAPMSLERAREIIRAAGSLAVTLEHDGEITWNAKDRRGSEYVSWGPDEPKAVLDGSFTADQLEALAVWMRAHAKVGE